MAQINYSDEMIGKVIKANCLPVDVYCEKRITAAMRKAFYEEDIFNFGASYGDKNSRVPVCDSIDHSKYIPIKKETAAPKSPPSSKDDWEIWRALSNWAKETSNINTYWIDFALEISNLLKSSKPLSDKQKENMTTCWKQAVKKGFKSY